MWEKEIKKKEVGRGKAWRSGVGGGGKGGERVGRKEDMKKWTVMKCEG